MLNKLFSPKNLKYGLIALLAVVLVGGAVTLAYLSKTTAAATNNFAPGKISTEIEEDPDVKGTIINKDPKIVNTGESACIVRMRATISPNAIADLVNQKDGITIDYDTKNWTLKDDGYWYYNHILPAKTDNKTSPLFTKIIGITDDKGHVLEKFKDLKDFQITLYQEAVQTEVSINGEKVTAYGADGKYDAAAAAKIWTAYDGKAIDPEPSTE
ncbi:hypothetical protein [Eubacterium sp.]|uniref:hypothetical protein n=1 Tax=Eubacterium sp. TaxID=142586 RepID=UPI0026DFF13A|nr:hypothetical protein [Eubacterium sp.]MDO5432228.1 hypothetical protein [Eubacterium sp.]